MTKKYIICGANSLGLYAYEELRKKHYEVMAIVDNNFGYEKILKHIPVICFDKVRELLGSCFEDAVFLITARGAKSVYEIWEQLKVMNCYNIGIIKPRAQRYQLTIEPDKDEFIGEIIWCTKNGKECAVVPRLEINLADNCNLNCKACSHFSSIFQQGSFYRFEEYVVDLKRLREVGKFVRLRLLGGEPLLLTDLDCYISITRTTFPEADIEIVTNGLLISKLDRNVLESLRENRISLVISPYKPTIMIKDKIEKILNENQIMWCMDGDSIDAFLRALTLEAVHDGYKTSKVCLQSGCTFLRNGRIYKCPFEGLFYEFCEYYKLNQLERYDGIDISDDSEKVYTRIKQLALEPVDMCRYCSEEIEMIPWSVKNSPDLNDWLYREGQ